MQAARKVSVDIHFCHPNRGWHAIVHMTDACGTVLSCSSFVTATLDKAVDAVLRALVPLYGIDTQACELTAQSIREAASPDIRSLDMTFPIHTTPTSRQSVSTLLAAPMAHQN